MTAPNGKVAKGALAVVGLIAFNLASIRLLFSADAANAYFLGDRIPLLCTFRAFHARPAASRAASS